MNAGIRWIVAFGWTVWVAQTGNIYAGLYYPIIVAGITFIVGSLLLKETRSVLILEQMPGDSN